MALSSAGVIRHLDDIAFFLNAAPTVRMSASEPLTVGSGEMSAVGPSAMLRVTNAQGTQNRSTYT